jgi:hypothetical protein
MLKGTWHLKAAGEAIMADAARLHRLASQISALAEAIYRAEIGPWIRPAPSPKKPPERANHYKRWSSEDTEELRRRWAANEPSKTIARALGRDDGVAIWMKARKIGLPKRGRVVKAAPAPDPDAFLKRRDDEIVGLLADRDQAEPGGAS